MEFLIRRTDGDWFDLPRSRIAEVLRPSSFASHPVPGWGDHRIEVEGVELSFSYEDPGIQLTFEDDIDDARAQQIVAEILASVEASTGQRGKIVRL